MNSTPILIAEKPIFMPLLNHRASCVIAGFGACLILFAFLLLPWAYGFAGSLIGHNSMTGFQIMLGELISDPILKQLSPIKTTPGLWLLIIPVVAALILLCGLIFNRWQTWRRSLWVIIFLMGLLSAYPIFRLYSQSEVWILYGKKAVVYHPQIESGIGMYVTLVGIFLALVGAIGGMIGKNRSDTEPVSPLTAAP